MEKHKVRNKDAGEEVIQNTNDGLVDRKAFASIQKSLEPAIARLDQNKKLLYEARRASAELKKSNALLKKAELSGDSVAISKARKSLKTSQIKNQKLKKQVLDINPADKAAMQIDSGIKRLKLEVGGRGPKGIKDIEKLEIEVMNVTNKVSKGPEIGTDRDVTYQLVVDGKKVDIPHEFVETHYSKSLFETLNPQANKIDLQKSEDILSQVWTRYGSCSYL